MKIIFVYNMYKRQYTYDKSFQSPLNNIRNKMKKSLESPLTIKRRRTNNRISQSLLLLTRNKI